MPSVEQIVRLTPKEEASIRQINFLADKILKETRTMLEKSASENASLMMSPNEMKARLEDLHRYTMAIHKELIDLK